MSLELDTELAEALQAESKRSGKPPAEIVDDAIARHLHLTDSISGPDALQPPEGTNSLDLLDRDDRF